MQLPRESSSSWTHIGYGSFTLAALSALSRAEDLFAPLVREKLGQLATELDVPLRRLLKEARDTQDAQIFGRPQSMAEQNTALLGLKVAARGALDAIKNGLGGGSEDHTSVREVFPRLLGTVTGADLDERPEVAARCADRMAGLPDFAAKEAALTRLRTWAQTARTKLDAAEAAYTGWETERSEEVVAKGKLRLALEATYGSLLSLFPGQRDLVESFFLKGDKPSEGGVDAPPAGG